MLAAALILAVMVIPFTSSVAREVLQVGAAGAARGRVRARRDAVRSDPRGAASTRAPASSAPIMLGFGRALGETMAVTMVIGNNPQMSLSLFAPQYTMAAVIANEFTEAADELYLNALIEIGLVLFIITLIVNVAVAAADLEHGAAARRALAAERAGRRLPEARMTRDSLAQALSLAVRRLLRAVGAAGAGAARASSCSSS